MTRLLVSVRDAWEATEALSGGAQVIDVKEPQFGSLGAASAEIRLAVRRVLDDATSSLMACNGEIPQLSAACGELREFHVDQPIEQLDGYSFAKIGLAGCASLPDWEQRWTSWTNSLPPATAPVAVIYADYQAVEAPSPWRVLQAAIEVGVKTLLIDTYNKSKGNILERLSACELVELTASAHDDGLLVAFAGSINADMLGDVLRFDPDWIAVRGAVCRGGRESKLDRELVKQFAARLSTPGSANTVTSRS